MKYGVAIALTAGLGLASASPWITPDNRWLRSDIEALAEAGVISAPVTQYPLPWAAISADLEQAMRQRVPEHLRPALQRVFQSLTNARETWSASAEISAATNREVVHSFGDGAQEKGQAQLTVDYTGSRLAIRARITEVQDPYDDDEVRTDGSVIGWAFDDWAVSVGAVDRWWGPGWSASVILTDNARPVPAISLQRLSSRAPESEWVRWIGPWTFETFLGQMEEERAIPNARLWGARLTMRPISTLEIGFSRTAIWAGDGRPSDWEAFYNMLIGNDNVGADLSRDEEPANQMAGVDMTWNLQPTLGWPLKAYMQYIGEDKLKKLIPSRATLQYGLSSHQFDWQSWQLRWYLEYTNTSTSAFQSVRGDNVIYEHHLYASGYRHLGRVMGASWDNDAATVAFGLMGSDHQANEWSIQLAWLDLNRDGTNRQPPAGNPVTPTAVELWQLDVTWRRYFPGWFVELAATGRTEPLPAYQETYEAYRTGGFGPDAGDRYRLFGRIYYRW